ncbi:MAG TPA: helix-turn-helix transcriptional regulator [Aggregatilinea sp.]|jgi:PadR family transcriptional regulator PadR|uniref:helix-turn-helix transcriptional regulator n=1 Tax=Aggregatilinea sp. TaxID=2806333 RepID=UPI002C6AD149|nr:helix-turn-helix transcriptional regulator [Aggregatilinea sp.]HML23784.1 helix-turn-helix transcriptional regulator [Aggregatilinea sp.]
MNIKGNLPLLILHVLSTGPRHGYTILKDIKQGSEGVLGVAEGTLYPILHDLEQRGLIEAFEETVGGRLRRCYRLTGAGRRELARQTDEWKRYSQAVNLLLGSAS